MGMETNVAGLPRGWNKIVRDSHVNVALFDFSGAPAAIRMVFKLLKDVCSDFTDTNCIISSRLIIQSKLIIYCSLNGGHIWSIAVKVGTEWAWKQTT